VRIAASPLLGLEQVADTPPDAILLDLRMPFVNGMGFLYRLRAQDAHRHTPVAIITGDSCIDDPAMVELQGLDAEIRFKPMWIDEVVALTRSLLAKRPPADRPPILTPAS
jgi:DNA-binding response OmpR family regulator